MLRSNFWERLAERHPYLVRDELDRVADTVIEEIAAALERGDRVELRGFGTFGVKQRRARTARNPKTRELVTVKGNKVAYFKAGSGLLSRLNEPPEGLTADPR